MISTISKESPAEHAGLKVGDVVTEIRATPIRDSSDLRNKIGQLRVGEAVQLARAAGREE